MEPTATVVEAMAATLGEKEAPAVEPEVLETARWKGKM
jgi:hypothetical protein